MKHFVIILFLLLSASFVTLHIILPYLEVKQELVQFDNYGKGAEEESEAKKINDASGKLYYLSYNDLLFRPITTRLLSSFCYAPLLPGYSNKPFTPPDLI